ncbi:sensor histidine kinase [Saccharothrix violaceirubra]|uniref:histidine kinase n=1 Tax=Saccharothrix violaceirubra TaxID=413306 RepID=A0A7W7T8X0_9PSEU|nr:sensor histidine kinase [Saccharothrix violaceirubra]MBB4967455.1 signal transduction histidine kinase [Saccharothrix violaceirubra]
MTPIGGEAAGDHRVPAALWDSLPVVLFLLNVLTTHPPGEWPVAVTLTVAAASPLVWRRRAPLVVFALVATAGFAQWVVDVQLPSAFALLVALYTVAANSGPRVTLVAGAVVEVGAVLACLRWTAEGAFLTPFVAVTAMIVAAAVLGVNVRTTKAYLEAVRDRAARRERERERQARVAVAEERTRITREMHDIVTHNLSVMVALTDAAVYAQHRSPEKATTAMLQISETGRQALTDMRRTLGILRVDEPDAERHPLPGIAQLGALADQLGAAGLPTRLDVDGDHAHVPATAQLTVYRVVQEALTNTLKHAPAGTRAEVRIRCSTESVALAVVDDGRGPLSDTPGHGITGMRERAAAYGGTLRAGPLPAGGWGVHTRLFLGSGGTVGA